MPAKQLEINKKNNFRRPYFGRMYAPVEKTGFVQGIHILQSIII